MRVLVFSPTYRLEPETVRALWALDWDDALDFLWTRDNPFPNDDGGRANILHNYEKGRAIFLAGPYDALLVIESDIIPPADTLEKLAALDTDVAYGVYLFRGSFPYQTNVCRFVAGPYPDSPLTLYPDDLKKVWGKQTRVSGAGLGCVLIARRVLEAIPFRGGALDQPHCDHFFTRDVWQRGFEMKADMTVLCGHKRPDGVILWPSLDGGIEELPDEAD